MPTEGSVASTAYVRRAQHSACSPSLTCPSYGDRRSETYCCASSKRPGEFYCCDQRHYAEWQREQAVSVFSSAEGIAGVVLGVLAAMVLTGLLCFFCNCCYVARVRRRRAAGTLPSTTQPASHRSHTQHYSAHQQQPPARGQYRALPQRPPGHPPTVIPSSFPDAPPPYDFAEHCAKKWDANT